MTSVLKRKTLNLPKKTPKDLRNSRTLFQEIDRYLMSEQTDDTPDRTHSPDSIDETFEEAFSDSSSILMRPRSITMTG